MGSADDKRARFSEARSDGDAGAWLSLCRGQSCRVREVCARYTSSPCDWQTYIVPVVQGAECPAFVGRATVGDLRDLAALAQQAAVVLQQRALVAQQRADLAQQRVDLAREMAAVRARADQAEQQGGAE